MQSLKFKIQKFSFIFALLTGIFAFIPAITVFVPQSVHAVTGIGGIGGANDCGDPTLQRNSTGLCLPASQSGNTGGINSLLIRVINLMLSLAAVVAILFIVIGGFQYILSAGNSESAEKGRSTVTNAAIGLAIIILAFTIVTAVNTTVGGCFSGFFGGLFGGSC